MTICCGFGAGAVANLLARLADERGRTGRMNEGRDSWWLGADRSWHRGSPPSGWRQGDDGRWHGPGGTTAELPVVVGAPWTDPPALPTRPVPVAPAQHLATGPGKPRRRPTGHRGSLDLSSLVMKVAVPALAGVIVLMAAGVCAIALGDDGRDPEPSSGELGAAIEAPAPGGAASATTTAAPPPVATDAPDDEAPGPSPGSTTAPAPTNTTATPSTNTTATPSTSPATTPTDPLAACSPGQRLTIERGNHPAAWYAARFDQDGDGIFCT
jgi:hypothetical protein